MSEFLSSYWCGWLVGTLNGAVLLQPAGRALWRWWQRRRQRAAGCRLGTVTILQHGASRTHVVHVPVACEVGGKVAIEYRDEGAVPTCECVPGSSRSACASARHVVACVCACHTGFTFAPAPEAS